MGCLSPRPLTARIRKLDASLGMKTPNKKVSVKDWSWIKRTRSYHVVCVVSSRLCCLSAGREINYHKAARIPSERRAQNQSVDGGNALDFLRCKRRLWGEAMWNKLLNCPWHVPEMKSVPEHLDIPGYLPHSQCTESKTFNSLGCTICPVRGAFRVATLKLLGVRTKGWKHRSQPFL